MSKLKHLLLSPLIVTSVVANIAAVAALGPDHLNKNDHHLHAEKRHSLRMLKNHHASGTNKLKKGEA
jgi:hypothetical protein